MKERYRYWENDVNELMLKKFGVGVDDIPDMPYHDWYDNDWTAAKAVKEAIKITNAGEWV